MFPKNTQESKREKLKDENNEGSLLLSEIRSDENNDLSWVLSAHQNYGACLTELFLEKTILVRNFGNKSYVCGKWVGQGSNECKILNVRITCHFIY